MYVVNEPVNSVNITNRNGIESIFSSIYNQLQQGLVKQRVNKHSSETSDTYPPSGTKWGTIQRSLNQIKVIGIKKSFPSFTNTDFFTPFLDEWGEFTDWMCNKIGGKIVIIVRDPRMALLSWKTTFDALKSTTEIQSQAWKQIAHTILKSAHNYIIIRYEDLIQNPTDILARIARHTGVKYSLRTPLPPIRKYTEAEYFKRKNLNIPDTKKTQRIIMGICKHEAKKLGYS